MQVNFWVCLCYAGEIWGPSALCRSNCVTILCLAMPPLRNRELLRINVKYASPSTQKLPQGLMLGHRGDKNHRRAPCCPMRSVDLSNRHRLMPEFCNIAYLAEFAIDWFASLRLANEENMGHYCLRNQLLLRRDGELCQKKTHFPHRNDIWRKLPWLLPPQRGHNALLDLLRTISAIQHDFPSTAYAKNSQAVLAVPPLQNKELARTNVKHA